MKNRSKTVWIFLLLFLLPLRFLQAQKYNLNFQNTSLAQALITISRQFDIKVAFDSEKLSSDTVNGNIAGNSADELISGLLQNSRFDFKLKHNQYLIVPREAEPFSTGPLSAQIMGSVRDNETGEQLPFATVYLSNSGYTTSSTENGTFSIKNLKNGPVQIKVSYIGYYSLDTIFSSQGKLINCDLKLRKNVQSIDSIIVKDNRLDMVDLRANADFGTTINPSKLIDLPLLAETDVFSSLKLFPGISYTENSSELSIRGGSGDQNLVLFDGQTLYNLSHYYGVVSALNPNVIKDIQIYKGGYDSRYGERVSGIVDITGKSGSQDKATVYGDINLISANLTAEVPLSNKITLVAAARRSYSDIYATSFAKGLFGKTNSPVRGDSLNLVNETKPSFYFYDLNAKLTYHVSATENISLSLYGGKDYFNNTYQGNTRGLIVNNSDINNWSNYGISASWLKQWSSSLFSNFLVGASGYTNNYSNLTNIDASQSVNNPQKYLPDANNFFNSTNENILKDFSVSLRNTYNFSNNNILNFGFLFRQNDVSYYKDAGKVYIYDNLKQTAGISSIYAGDRILLTDKLSLKPGFRFTFYSGDGKVYFEPRFSANYQFTESFSVRLAAGHYVQFLSQALSQQDAGYNKNFWILSDNSLHPVVSSNHFILGSTLELGDFLLDAETYYKSYSGLEEYMYASQFLKNGDFPDMFGHMNPGISNPPSYFLNGNGRAYGIDLMLRYKWKNYTSWVSSSYGRSFRQYLQVNQGNEIPSPVDQPIQLSWTNMMSLGKWNFALSTLYSTGRPYIEFQTGDVNKGIYRQYKRLPDYSRTDFSANYNFNLGKSRFKTGVSVLNIFNRQNYFDINARKFDFNNISFSQTTLILSQSLSVNFFIHFIL